MEFLGLKDEYSESDLEEALILHLEKFLLELGNDFAFVGRQRRLRIGHEWFRVDLLLFHRPLRCLVIIDLKIGALVHGDIGQMNLYCNYARAHWTQPDEHPPVGLILCTQKDEALARYALDGLHNKLLVREYLTGTPIGIGTGARSQPRTRSSRPSRRSAPDGAKKIVFWLRSAVGERGKWSGGRRGAHSGTKPEHNARRRAADGSPPLLRLSTVQAHDERAV